MAAPCLFGALIGDASSRGPLTVGYLIGGTGLAPRPPAAPGMHPPAVSRTGPDGPAEDARSRLAGLVVRALGDDHAVECVVAQGGPVRVLPRASREAHLLVLDSPRQEKLGSLGSGKLLAPRLIYRSACPVVTMPASGRGASRVRRIAAAVAESAVRAGRPGLPPIPGVQPRPGGYTAD